MEVPWNRRYQTWKSLWCISCRTTRAPLAQWSIFFQTAVSQLVPTQKSQQVAREAATRLLFRKIFEEYILAFLYFQSGNRKNPKGLKSMHSWPPPFGRCLAMPSRCSHHSLLVGRYPFVLLMPACNSRCQSGVLMKT